MKKLNFCRDCVWAKPQTVKTGWFSEKEDFTYARCTHPSATEEGSYDLVTGIKKADSLLYCNTNRQFECGTEAKFFQPK